MISRSDLALSSTNLCFHLLINLRKLAFTTPSAILHNVSTRFIHKSHTSHINSRNIHTYSSEFPCARDANILGLTINDCDSVYAYRHRLNFTSDGTLLNDELNNAKLSASPDHPESLLDALLQVAVCEVYIG